MWDICASLRHGTWVTGGSHALLSDNWRAAKISSDIPSLPRSVAAALRRWREVRSGSSHLWSELSWILNGHLLEDQFSWLLLGANGKNPTVFPFWIDFPDKRWTSCKNWTMYNTEQQCSIASSVCKVCLDSFRILYVRVLLFLQIEFPSLNFNFLRQNNNCNT